MKKKYMKIVLDEELHRELKVYSVEINKTMNDIIADLIRQHLQEKKEEK